MRTEFPHDPVFVRRLISLQFPKWADFPLHRFASDGTVNVIYRLGDDLAVRLPVDEEGSEQVTKECHWLPVLEPHLPLDVPTPLAMGKPALDYPWHWDVYPWIEGDNAIAGRLDDPWQAALDLGRFITALQRVDPAGGPPPGKHNFYRGVPLATREGAVRQALADLSGILDIAAAASAWEEALAAPLWTGPPVWFHGDLLPGNLLVRDGRLCAVIDFGGLGVGDPACDWIFAWNLLSAEIREKLRVTLAIDRDTWARGRGWALSVGLIALPYYQARNPVFAGVARQLIDEVLADHG